MLDIQGDWFLNLIPLFMVVGILLFIFSVFGGIGMDGEFGYNLRRYWWVVALLGLPIFFVIWGVDLSMFILFLVIFTVAGALFFWWMENDFEMPKGDPLKDAFKWLRENFRW